MKPFLIGLLTAFVMLSCSSGPVTEADLEGRTFAFANLKEVVIDNPKVKALIDEANEKMGGMPTPAYQFDKSGKGVAKDFGPFRKMDFPLTWALSGDTLYTDIEYIEGPRYNTFHIKKEGDGFILRRVGETHEYALKPL